MIPSKNAVALIKKWEGCKLEAYQDQRGIWTVGYGTTGPGIVEGLTIAQSTAEAMLTGHVKEIGLELTDLVYNLLNQNQFDACTSLLYNIGLAAFKSSTMLRLLRNLDFGDASKEFPKWDHTNSKANPGLLARRLDEQALFNLIL